MIYLEEFISPEPNTGCWLWLDKLDLDGYALYKNDKAHRVIFRFYNKTEVIEKKLLHHTCRTKCCVNPEHLVVCKNQGEHNKLHAKDPKARRKITIELELQVVELYKKNKHVTRTAFLMKLSQSATSKILHRHKVLTPNGSHKASSNFIGGPRKKNLLN